MALGSLLEKRRLRQKLEGDPETTGHIVSERGVGYKFVAVG